MAKGKEKHQARLDAVNLLGKDVARRAGRKCEWCEGAEELLAYDLDPEVEPSLDTVALFCARCRAVDEGRDDDPRTLRFLEGVIWSEVPGIQRRALAALRRVDADWARQSLEAFGDLAEAEDGE